MSTKKCSRCEKTVYPTEELKCLDKVWHKLCFKCQECGMTLNMKTYKGFNRLPYCNAHCPQAKHTSIADTPEIRRLAENTRIQSNVKYHEDFEKQKGKVTAVADDPETLRIRNTTKIISNVSYHGELDKKKEMEQRRQLASAGGERNGEAAPPAQEPPRIAAPHHQPPKESPYSSKLSSTVIFTSQDGAVDNPPSRRIGSIADYDPINDNYGSVATGPRTAAPPPATNFYNAPPPVSEVVPPVVPQVQPNYNKPAAPPVMSFCAMYDYTAQDMDEVSFREGDIIINCKPIDEGWMVGTVQRTGQSGMLPANYVEPIGSPPLA